MPLTDVQKDAALAVRDLKIAVWDKKQVAAALSPVLGVDEPEKFRVLASEFTLSVDQILDGSFD